MYQQPIPQLRLEPGRLRRHDAAGVRDGHEVADRDRVDRECHGRLARIDGLLERSSAAGTANEIDPLVGANVANAQNWLENGGLQASDVEAVGSRGARD